MTTDLMPTPPSVLVPTDQIDPAYRRLRRLVFLGIFIGYGVCYLVRTNLSLAIPDP